MKRMYYLPFLFDILAAKYQHKELENSNIFKNSDCHEYLLTGLYSKTHHNILLVTAFIFLQMLRLSGFKGHG